MMLIVKYQWCIKEISAVIGSFIGHESCT